MLEEKEIKFYSCKYDRAFKEVFLNEKNKEMLKRLLEKILKEKINNIIVRPTEIITNNVKVKAKRLDALIETEKERIGIEVNSEIKEYLYPRNMAYICNEYSRYILVGEEYNENLKIIQINLTYGKKDKK